ncbi:hypothetical protein Tco_0775348 [Tanacetum coccineum]
MTQPQRQADVHQDELCPPNKLYALMDANKKMDLDNPLCPNESKILANILQNHPLRFGIAASLSIPWIYLGKELSDVCCGVRGRSSYDPVTPIVTLTQGNIGSTSAPRSPNLLKDEGRSQVQSHGKSIVQSRLKSHDELEVKQNVQKVKEHLIAKEIKKLVDGMENVANVLSVDSSTIRQNDNPIDPGTRLEHKSDKESLEVEITAEVQPINVNEEEEESAEDDFKLKRREKGKHGEESRSTPSPTTIRSPRIYFTRISSDTEKL